MKKLLANGQVLIVSQPRNAVWSGRRPFRAWAQNDFVLWGEAGQPIAWDATLKDGHAYRYFYDPDLQGTALGSVIFALNDLGAPPWGGLLRGELFNATVRPECVGKQLVA